MLCRATLCYRTLRASALPLLATLLSCNSMIGIQELSHEPELCNNGILDPGETDIDCGGPDCKKCEEKRTCLLHSDCKTKFCRTATGQCMIPACNDNIKNGNESGVDCAGDCEKCDFGKTCSSADHCRSGRCKQGLCVDALCGDGLHNGDETDIDCGGPNCLPCAASRMCKTATDCLSMGCDGNQCTGASCNDNVLNGKETGRDCGQTCPRKCANGEGCKTPMDCESGVCITGQCQPPGCMNAMVQAEGCNCIDDTCDGVADEETLVNGISSLCGQGMVCVKAGSICQCAEECTGKDSCAAGTTCQAASQTTLGGSGMYCIPTPPPPNP